MRPSFDWVAVARKKKRAWKRLSHQRRRFSGKDDDPFDHDDHSGSDSDDDHERGASSVGNEEDDLPTTLRSPVPTQIQIEVEGNKPTTTTIPATSRTIARATSVNLSNNSPASSGVMPNTNSVPQAKAALGNASTARRLSPVAEHVVIAVASVLGTLLLIFVAFMFYRRSRHRPSSKPYDLFDKDEPEEKKGAPPFARFWPRSGAAKSRTRNREWRGRISSLCGARNNASTTPDSIYGYPNITGPVPGRQAQWRGRVGLDIPPVPPLVRPVPAANPSTRLDPLGQNRRKTLRFSFEPSVRREACYNSIQQELVIQREVTSTPSLSSSRQSLPPSHLGVPVSENRHSATTTTTITNGGSVSRYLPIGKWVEKQVRKGTRSNQNAYPDPSSSPPLLPPLLRLSWFLPAMPVVLSRFSLSSGSELSNSSSIVEIVEDLEKLVKDQV